MLLFISGLLITGCKTGSDNKSDAIFDSYKIADGFELHLAAAEPIIEAPIAMDFDNRGQRGWWKCMVLCLTWQALEMINPMEE